MSCNFYESDSLLTFDDRRRASRYILILHAPFASICRCALSFLSSAHFCISAVRLAIYIGIEIISAWTRSIETNVNREGKKNWLLRFVRICCLSPCFFSRIFFFFFFLFWQTQPCFRIIRHLFLFYGDCFVIKNGIAIGNNIFFLFLVLFWLVNVSPRQVCRVYHHTKLILKFFVLLLLSLNWPAIQCHCHFSLIWINILYVCVMCVSTRQNNKMDKQIKVWSIECCMEISCRSLCISDNEIRTRATLPRSLKTRRQNNGQCLALSHDR